MTEDKKELVEICKYIKKLEAQLKQADEMILDLFIQACGGSELDYCKYDHMCMSSYEHAQYYLIERGLIKESECSRG